MCERALVTWPVWGQMLHRGHKGQKCHFHQKCFLSIGLQSMVMWLMHIHQLDNLYKSVLAKISIWGHLRSQGAKDHFHQKTKQNKTKQNKANIFPPDYTVWSCESCIFISSIPSTKFFRSNFSLGSFGITGGKKVIFTKNVIHSNSPIRNMLNYLIQS